MRTINWNVVHCSATVEGKHFDVDDIDRWHKQRGWSGCGYHFVILLDGTIQEGRPEEKQGAHVKGFNKNSIGICYIGGLDKNLAPKDTRTPAQKKSLSELLTKLSRKHKGSKIKGHRDFSPDLNGNGIIEPFEFSKACPCFNAADEYKNL